MHAQGELTKYNFEGGKRIDTESLMSEPLGIDAYKAAHKGLVIVCHDVFIEHKGKILLVNRDNFPAKDHLWPVGGRLKRGMPAEDSLREKAHEESNLFLEDLTYMGIGRTFFETDPWNHGKGTDTINLVYHAKGEGTIKLDKLHKDPVLVGKEDYLSIRKNLHPYVVNYMDFLWSHGKKELDPNNQEMTEWMDNFELK